MRVQSGVGQFALCALCLSLLSLNCAIADERPSSLGPQDESEWQASASSWCGKAEAEVLQQLKAADRNPNALSRSIKAGYLIALGDLARLQGKHTQAEVAYQQALELAQAQLKHIEGDVTAPIETLVAVRYGRGHFYRSRGELVKAEAEFKEAKNAGAMLLSVWNPALARSSGALASVISTRGDLDQAHQLCTWAVDRVIAYCSTNDAEIAWIDDMMGSAYARAGHHAEALPVYEHMLAVREASLAPEHPDLADAHNRLASVLYELKRREDAIPHLRKALSIRIKAFGPDHPHTALSRKNLARAQSRAVAAP